MALECFLENEWLVLGLVAWKFLVVVGTIHRFYLCELELESYQFPCLTVALWVLLSCPQSKRSSVCLRKTEYSDQMVCCLADGSLEVSWFPLWVWVCQHLHRYRGLNRP